MVTLKDGKKYSAEISESGFVQIRGRGGEFSLTPREYSEWWKSGVINPLPDEEQTAWKNSAIDLPSKTEDDY